MSRAVLTLGVAAVLLSACASMAPNARSVEQRNADRETLKVILEYCEVTITGNTQAEVNASALPSAKAGLGVQLGGTCKPLGRPSPEIPAQGGP